jgi:hypothetical protein
MIDHWYDSIAVAHGQRAPGEKIVLDIDDDKRVMFPEYKISL